MHARGRRLSWLQPVVCRHCLLPSPAHRQTLLVTQAGWTGNAVVAECVAEVAARMPVIEVHYSNIVAKGLKTEVVPCANNPIAMPPHTPGTVEQRATVAGHPRRVLASRVATRRRARAPCRGHTRAHACTHRRWAHGTQLHAILVVFCGSGLDSCQLREKTNDGGVRRGSTAAASSMV